MKKIKHFADDPFLFHKKVLKCKRSGKTKDIVESLDADIQGCFSVYNARFSNDTLQELEALTVSEEQKKALLDMYSFRMRPFQELLKVLTTDANNRISNICPNCTVGIVESLDHCIPKSEFPEFSDNLLNLMPCCMYCNSKKSSVWRKRGQRVFLNLFLDELPNVRYLFVQTHIKDGVPVFKFFIDNRNCIENNLYRKIEKHYSTLDLCNVFADNSDDVVDDLAFQFKSVPGLPEEQIRNMFVKQAELWQAKFGYNYWKSALVLECCNNANVFSYIAGK